MPLNLRNSELIGGSLGSLAALIKSYACKSSAETTVFWIAVLGLIGAYGGGKALKEFNSQLGESIEEEVNEKIRDPNFNPNNSQSVISLLRNKSGEFFSSQIKKLVMNTVDRIDRNDIPSPNPNSQLYEIARSSIESRIKLESVIDKSLQENHCPKFFSKPLANKITNIVETKVLPTMIDESGLNQFTETATKSVGMAVGALVAGALLI